MNSRSATMLAVALLTTSVLVTPTNVRAAVAPSQEQTEEAIEAEIDVLGELAYSEPKNAIPRLTKLIDRAQPELKSYLMSFRGAAYLIDGQLKRAEENFDEAHRLDPVSEFPSLNRFIAGLNAQQFGQSSKGLDELIAVAPDRVRSLDRHTVYYYLRSYKDPHGDDQRIALAELGFGGLDGIYLSKTAIELLLKRGETARAAALLDRFSDASLYQEMMVNRNFQPLWDSLEKRSGEAMGDVGTKNIEQAENAYRAEPGNVPVRRRLVEAYSALRRFDDADRIGRDFAATPAGLREVDEDGGWLINAHVYALHDAGRFDDAQRRFQELIDAKKDEGWTISMIINQLELVVREKRYAESERMLPFAEQQVVKSGSPYAKQLVRRLRLCTNAGLGKPTDGLMTEFRAHEKDSRGASVEGYMCAGAKADAKRMALQMLSSKDDVSTVLTSLQKGRLISTDPSVWEGYWSELRQDPEVEAAFQRVGRDLPARFLVK